MSTLLEDLRQLAIKEGEVAALRVYVDAKLVIELWKINLVDDVMDVYELQFNRVLGSVLKVQGSPWFGKIIEHKVYAKSPYLLGTLRKRDTESSSNDYFHIEITLEQGHMDIVAADFSFSLIKKIPRAPL